MTSELKPCPFCGEEPTVIDCDDTVSFYVECENSECGIKPLSDTANTRNEALEIWNTRATPPTDTLAGLKRIEVISPNVPNGCGEYVLHSEAAAVVATRDIEIMRLKAAYEDILKASLTQKSRLTAAEAELDKLKAQEPAGWFHFCISTGEYTAEWCRVKPYDHHGFRPLYASPVSDSLKAECERYKVALEKINSDFELTTSRIILRNIARAALNVEASPLAPEGGRG